MKTQKSILIALLCIAFVAVQSCKKKNEAPVVTIEEPMLGDTIVSLGELHFQGTASDDNQLHEGKLEVLRASDDSVLLKATLTVHALKSYAFHEHFDILTTTPIAAKARATFSDHDEVTTVKEVAVQLMP
jgi:hypothetical protein